MRNGFCNIAVTLQRATRVRDEYGHDDITWGTSIATLWVSVKTRVRAAAYADGTVQIDSVVFTTPWYSGFDIARGDRIVWESENYEIQTVMDRDGKRMFIDCDTVQVAA